MENPTTEVPVGSNPRCSRCSECKESFRPNLRLKTRQKTCCKRECQLKQRARYRQQYRRKNLGSEQEYSDKAKENRPFNFWKTYRKNHPGSSERNRLNTKLRKRLSRAGLQRQLDIVQVIDPPGYFDLFLEFATSHRSLIAVCGGSQAA